jgi:hypothetical protein
MRPDVARDVSLAAHGGLSLARCAVLYHLSPMALYRLVCAFGRQSLVTVLTRCGLPLPVYVLVDEKHSRCLTEKVYLPTIVRGRGIWHLGYTGDASAVAFTQSYGEFQRAASQQEPAYRVQGILTDGFDSTVSVEFTPRHTIIGVTLKPERTQPGIRTRAEGVPKESRLPRAEATQAFHRGPPRGRGRWLLSDFYS